ncbi:hypothetical protein B6259_00150 [Ruminococcaceae bacterium CPB6]|mgnify:FL=1|nr:hypothetical protein B6259_00150 [Ruminococcaceae bacterium CPB6]
MKLKRFTAGVLACALVVGAAAGCTIGKDESWCAKTANLTLPSGVYIYELYNAYSEAQSKTTTADMKKAKIDNKDAMTWVNDRAKQLTNELFVLNDKMKQMKLSLTSSENSAVEQAAQNAWAQQFSSTLADKHVSESSFQTAYAEYIYQLRKVFMGTYDAGGSKAIPTSTQKDYFEKHYSDIEYMFVPLEKPASSASSGAVSSAASAAAGSAAATSSGTTAMTASEKAALKKELDGYLSQIRGGKTTLKAASTSFANAHGTSDTYQAMTGDMDSSTVASSLPTDMISAVKGMKAGETRLLEASSSYYVLITKNDIKEKADSFLKNGDNRLQLLYALKGETFLQDIENEAKSYKGATWNDAVTKKFTADLYYTAPSSTASAASAAAPVSSAAVSSTASSKASSASSKAASSAASSKK